MEFSAVIKILIPIKSKTYLYYLWWSTSELSEINQRAERIC